MRERERGSERERQERAGKSEGYSYLTVLLMEVGRFASRTGPWSSLAKPNTRETMIGSRKSGLAYE